LIGIFTVVIPRVRRLFDSFKATLPLLTRILLAASDIVSGWWWIVLPAIVAAIWLFVRWTRSPKGREKWHRFLLKVPILGKIVRTIAVSRFCRTLATLLISGVPILTAFEIVRRVVQNEVLAKAIEESSRNIQEGQSIATPLRQSGQFPPLVTTMISIGERTGDLEPMLDKVANAYDEYVAQALETFTSMLAPLLIVFMGGTIGFVALALLLPMLQMSRMIGS
jgi:general secretion pathway protein F